MNNEPDGETAPRRAAPTGAIDRTAIDWLVRMSDAPDDRALRAAFERWRLADPAHDSAWRRHTRTWSLMGWTAPALEDRWRVAADVPARAAPPAAAHGPAPLPGRRPLRRFRFRLPSIRIMAAAMVATCLILAVTPSLVLRLRADGMTSTAELRQVRLPDGSRLTLAPESAFRLAFTDTVRQVELLKGQALFEVHPDAHRPFRVLSGDMAATALGTRFDVWLRNGRTRVAVQSGTVRVEAPGRPDTARTLGPGGWFRLDGNGQPVEANVPVEMVGAWTDGALPVRDRRISSVVNTLRPWFDGVIVLTDEDLGARRVNGVYDLRDPVGAMTEIARTHGAVVHRYTPWLVVLAAE